MSNGAIIINVSRAAATRLRAITKFDLKSIRIVHRVALYIVYTLNVCVCGDSTRTQTGHSQCIMDEKGRKNSIV